MTGDLIVDYLENKEKEYERKQKLLYNALIKYLEKINNKGYLEADIKTLASLGNTIKEIARNIGLFDFDTKLIPELLSENKKLYDFANINKIYNTDEFNKVLVAYTEILNNNVNFGIVGKISDALLSNIVTKNKTDVAMKQLDLLINDRNIIKTNIIPTYDYYYNNVNNQISENVRINFELKNFDYIGSTIESSRAFCIHTRNVIGNGTITRNELQKILQDYCPNGEPSKESVILENNGERAKYIKGGGMKRGTTIENIIANKGGWRCRHTAHWVKVARKK